MKPPAYWLDGTPSGIGMRAWDKGRMDSLISMMWGDRRDALIMDRLVGTPVETLLTKMLDTLSRMDK